MKLSAQMEKQVKEANKTVRQLKKATPGIFPAYGRLLAARAAMNKASQELDAAETAWENLGKYPK